MTYKDLWGDVKTYPGTLEEQARACLKEIREAFLEEARKDRAEHNRQEKRKKPIANFRRL